jgi:hypothetical protein
MAEASDWSNRYRNQPEGSLYRSLICPTIRYAYPPSPIAYRLPLFTERTGHRACHAIQGDAIASAKNVRTAWIRDRHNRDHDRTWAASAGVS